MIVKLLGGSDEVQGETPGPYVRTLWVRIGIYGGTSKISDAAKVLRSVLAEIKIPTDMDYIVRFGRDYLMVGFGSYSAKTSTLRSARELWASVPMNIPTLLRVVEYANK
jgi:hypothetical protein